MARVKDLIKMLVDCDPNDQVFLKDVNEKEIAGAICTREVGHEKGRMELGALFG